MGETFFPPYSSESSGSLQLTNESVQLNDTCSLDAIVTYSLTVSNASAVFLQEVSVDFSAGTNLPPVDITVSGLGALEPLRGRNTWQKAM